MRGAWHVGRRAAVTVTITALVPLWAGAGGIAAGYSAFPAAHRFAASGVNWSGTGWASAGGNNVSDVANVIGAKGAAASVLDGKGVGITLIDTGVASVPGLPSSHIVNGPDLSFDSQASNLRYLDTFGHGTHLAGIMVGNDSTVGLRGIAPGAKLTSVKVGGSGGAVDVSQVIAALQWAVVHRNDDPSYPTKVIALAYGTDAAAVRETDPLMFAVENAFWNNITVVVAGGNAASSLGRLNNPASDPYVVKVGSANTQGTVSQADDTLSTFTSISPTTQLDVVAPGESIVSLRVEGGAIDVAFPAARVGSTLFRGSGSSQATAVVAGAAALLYQKAPNTSAAVMREWLRRSATPMTGANASRAVGELNIAAALAQGAPTNLVGNGGLGSSSGVGSLEASRGDSHVTNTSSTLAGATDLYGSFSTSTYAADVQKGTAWSGGVWMGHRVAGDGWTGSSWASKTWSSGAWSSRDWSGQSWYDPGWSTHTWSGRYWSGGAWSGRYWSGSIWEAHDFANATWASADWK
ncbi:MAG: serine protease AprX [Micromonosporaceae bacterium]|nr:serine protease AprX [Micromonosporaceae bacterium]